MHLFASVISGQFICTASVVSTHCICSQYTLLLSPDSDWAWPYGVCMALSVWVWLWMAADCIMVGLGLGRVCLGVPCHLGRDPSDFCPQLSSALHCSGARLSRSLWWDVLGRKTPHNFITSLHALGSLVPDIDTSIPLLKNGPPSGKKLVPVCLVVIC